MTISSIFPEDFTTWQGNFLIELDIDWAAEEVIEDTISLLDDYKIPATLFATHKSAALSNILRKPQFEIGIHPNFVPLLRGEHSAGRDFKEVISRLLEIFPDVKSSKAHSLVDSSILLQHYSDVGITHDNTYFIDFPGMQPLMPWRLWNKMVRVPLFWEDDYDCLTAYPRNFRELLNVSDGLKVFGFHPLHIFLNTESLERYEKTRSFHHDPKRLIDFRYNGIGTRTKFIQLLEHMSQNI